MGIIERDKLGRIVKSSGTHGMRQTRFYDIWHKILKRCNKQSCDKYKYYGGRGIKVLWNSFAEFRDDMYESYLEHSRKFGEKNTTIDRIDNNGSYCKENCRWATWKEQFRNRSDNRMITFDGISLCLQDWANKLGFKREVIATRIDRYKWPIERALTEIPYRGKNQFSKRT